MRTRCRWLEGAIALAEVWRELAGEEAGEKAADDCVAGERAVGGGIGGGGGEELGLLVGLDLAIESLGGEAAAVGAAVVWWRESCCSHCPLAEEREGGDTEGEEGAPKAGAVRLAGRVGGEMARPGGDDALALGGVVDEAGGEGRSG